MDLRIETPRRSIARDLRASTVDGCCYSGMVGLGETYFIALFLAVGFGETTVAWLATLPVFAGSLVQMATPRAIEWLGSWKRWVVLNAVLQGVSLLGLAWLVGSNRATAVTVFAVVSLYFGCGQATAPAWNMWIERMVPRSIRTRFLSRRHRAAQLSLLAVVVTASALFRWTESTGTSPVVALFGFLLCAGMLRLVSAWCLSRQTEDLQWLEQSRREVTEHQEAETGIAALPARTFRQLMLFMVLMQLAVYISSAFFTPFKLKALRLDYAQFSLLVIMAYVGKIVSLGLAGRLAARWGSFRLLLLGAIGIVPMAGLWAVSQNFIWLAVVQFSSGFMWACYELAMVMVFVEVIPRGRRLRWLSQYNVANSLAMVAGTALGAGLFIGFGEGYLGYLVIFACSSICRLLFIGMFPFSTLSRAGDSGARPQRRFVVFSHSFELLGRGLFRAWQAIPRDDLRESNNRKAA